MKKDVLFAGFFVLMIILAGGCSQAGKGAQPGSSDTGTVAIATKVPTKASTVGVGGQIKPVPTSTPKPGQSSGVSYFAIENPATEYTWLVKDITFGSAGEISSYTVVDKSGRVADPKKESIPESDIRWSDRYGRELWNRGWLRNWVSSSKPTWEEIRGVTIWIIWGALWDATKDPTLSIDRFVGSVPFPPDSRYIDQWLQLTYCINFNRGSPWLADTLSRMGNLKPDVFPTPEPKYDAPEKVAKFIPKVIEVAKVKGWGG